jgi:PAS domain S-box-containing protein
MVGRIVNWLKRRSRFSLIAGGLAYVALIGTADSLTPAALLFAIFYLPAIMVVTWFAGRTAGILIATASAAAWLIVGQMLAAPESPAFIPYWNAISGLAVFLAVVFLLSALKGLNERLEERVEQRTRELTAEVESHKRTADLLRASEERFRQMAEGINDVFWMMDVECSQILYVSPAYEQIWGRTCASLYAAPNSKLEAVHAEEHEQMVEAMTKERFSEGYDEQYRVLRPDGELRWIHERAFPIYDKAGAVYRVAGIAEDVTSRKQLERKVLEVSDQEQRRIGQDLHDGLCQHLTATMFASKILEEELGQKDLPQAAQAKQITAFIDRAISQARNVARGLDPVKVAQNGLTSALEELASTIQNIHRVRCVFRSSGPVFVDNNAAAIHLYRIAQEAVSNSVKHAKPSQIEIGLDTVDDRLILSVRDDGVGWFEPSSQGNGMGFHTMNYRASMIGAQLQIQRARNKGTVVTCSVPKIAVVHAIKKGA